jgi:hypothetical protein
MAATRPSTVTVLTRGLTGRCPACGCGHVFRRSTVAAAGDGVSGASATPSAVASSRACDACGWRFERCVGHWVGGNEINLLGAFATGVAAYAAAAAFLGLTPAAAWIATAATGVFSVAAYRRCRCVFFALDYLLDPEPDATCAASRDDDRDGGAGRDRPRDEPRPPLPPVPSPLPQPATAHADSTGSFIVPPPAASPPPATVSS